MIRTIYNWVLNCELNKRIQIRLYLYNTILARQNDIEEKYGSRIVLDYLTIVS